MLQANYHDDNAKNDHVETSPLATPFRYVRYTNKIYQGTSCRKGTSEDPRALKINTTIEYTFTPMKVKIPFRKSIRHTDKLSISA